MEEAGAAAQLLHDLRGSALPRRMDETGRRRLFSLLGQMLDGGGALPGALAVLRRAAAGHRGDRRALSLFRAAASRIRSRARRLIELARHGDFLTAQIAAFPLLLDELIDERLFEQLPVRAELEQELEARLADGDAGDEEELVEAAAPLPARGACSASRVADLTGGLPLMQVSDRLTDIAELIVAQRAASSAGDSSPRTTARRCAAPAPSGARCGVCAVGYGKLGGIELGYASDLDLVFLHDSTGPGQETEGARSVDNQVFFVRFVQRIVHLLTDALGRRPPLRGRHAAAAERQGRHAGHQHRGLRRLPARGGLDLGAPGAAARARGGRRRRAARALRGGAPRICCSQHVRRDTLREEVQRMRERMRARAVGGRGRRVRPQAGPRRDRRHRVPGAVLGAALGGPSIRRSRGSRTRSASSSRWPRRTSCRRRPSTC